MRYATMTMTYNVNDDENVDDDENELGLKARKFCSPRASPWVWDDYENARPIGAMVVSPQRGNILAKRQYHVPSNNANTTSHQKITPKIWHNHSPKYTFILYFTQKWWT